VGEKEVRIRALKAHHLERRIGVDGFHEVEDLVIHLIVDRVDRWVVESDLPVSGHLLIGGDPGLLLVHPAFFSSVLSAGRSHAIRRRPLHGVIAQRVSADPPGKDEPKPAASRRHHSTE
jgi:hypothetical protein